MSDASDLTEDLLTGRRSRIADPVPRGPGDPATQAALFADVRQALDELGALRAKDPARALAVLQSLLNDDTLTTADLDSFIDVWQTAVDKPEEFAVRISGPVPKGPADWWDALRGFVHRPDGPSDDEVAMLAKMKASYVLPDHPLAPPINPHERKFETYDPAWVPLLRAKLGEKDWPTGLVPMRRHHTTQDFVYTATAADGSALAADAPVTIGLVSDFGTGYYHSWGIAQQLAAWAFPYTFHLGDVYYAGRPDEFKSYFQLPLFETVAHTRLLGFAENHELYSGGGSYLEYFDALRREGRTPQEASYFCVRFPKHQIIGIDVNWQGRQRYRDPELRAWLGAQLANAGGRTNILLTGSAPFDHGGTNSTILMQDLWEFVGTGAIGLWFWGDDHYCALFDRRPPEVPFYGSCIGHGGYPGDRQGEWRASYKTYPLWVEDLARFPAATKMRPDMSNNGWCQATLRPDGGVDLLYVDWLWCKRAAVSFARDGAGLQAGTVTVTDRDSDPQIHKP